MVAQQPTHLACFVVVVHRPHTTLVSWVFRPADGAGVVLALQHLVVNVAVDGELVFQKTVMPFGVRFGVACLTDTQTVAWLSIRLEIAVPVSVEKLVRPRVGDLTPLALVSVAFPFVSYGTHLSPLSSNRLYLSSTRLSR